MKYMLDIYCFITIHPTTLWLKTTHVYYLIVSVSHNIGIRSCISCKSEIKVFAEDGVSCEGLTGEESAS